MLEHQDVFGFGFLNETQMCGGVYDWSPNTKFNCCVRWLPTAAIIQTPRHSKRKMSSSWNVFINQTGIESRHWCYITVEEEALLSCSSSHVSWASFSWGQAEASKNNWEFRTRQRTPPTWDNSRGKRQRHGRCYCLHLIQYCVFIMHFPPSTVYFLSLQSCCNLYNSYSYLKNVHHYCLYMDFTMELRGLIGAKSGKKYVK